MWVRIPPGPNTLASVQNVKRKSLPNTNQQAKQDFVTNVVCTLGASINKNKPIPGARKKQASKPSTGIRRRDILTANNSLSPCGKHGVIRPTHASMLWYLSRFHWYYIQSVPEWRGYHYREGNYYGHSIQINLYAPIAQW